MTGWTPTEMTTPISISRAPISRAPTGTGEAPVDAAVARLDDLDPNDLDSQVRVFADIHSRLVQALDAADGGSAAEQT